MKEKNVSTRTVHVDYFVLKYKIRHIIIILSYLYINFRESNGENLNGIESDIILWIRDEIDTNISHVQPIL